MPCNDSSSGLNLFLDQEERFVGFEFAKITCSGEITGETGYAEFCKGLLLPEILEQDFYMLVSVLDLNDNDEAKFILHLEWDALRSAVSTYLGVDHEGVDESRCQVTSVEVTEEGTEVALVVLPPAQMPKIKSCAKGDG